MSLKGQSKRIPNGIPANCFKLQALNRVDDIGSLDICMSMYAISYLLDLSERCEVRIRSICPYLKSLLAVVETL